MHLRDDCDYVIGIVLPSLLNEPLEDVDIVEHFTAEEAQKLQLQSLPAKLNHADEKTYEIGTVLASATTSVSGRILMELKTDEPQAAYASKSIAGGHYRGLSLGHGYHRRCNNSGSSFVRKQAREVSVCERGARSGSDIEYFFPSRKTLSRLSDADLRNMVKQYKYSEQMKRRSLTADNRSQYIRDLHALINERRDRIITQYNLQPVSQQGKTTQPNYTVAGVYMSESTATKMDVESAAASVMSEEAAKAKPTTEQEPPAPSAVDSPVPSPPKNSTNNELADTQRQLIELKERQLEWMKVAKEREEELNSIRKEESARKEQERAKAMASAERAVESFRQHAKTHGSTDETIDGQISGFRKYIEANPFEASTHINGITEMMVRAGKTMVEKNNRGLEETMKHLQRNDDGFYREAVPGLSDFHNRFAELQKQEEQLLARPIVQPEIQAPTFSAAHTNTVAPMNTTSMPTPIAETGVVNASANRSAPMNVERRSKREEFLFQCQSRGVISNYDEVRDGRWMDQFGEVRASANGSKPDRVLSRGNFEPYEKQEDFGMEEWCSETNQLMLEAIAAQAGRGTVMLK